jgi:hypothetical protein
MGFSLHSPLNPADVQILFCGDYESSGESNAGAAAINSMTQCAGGRSRPEFNQASSP